MSRLWASKYDDATQRELMDIATGMMEVGDQRSAARELLYAQVLKRSEFFPVRTEAMVATLQKVRETFSIEGSIFLIAGRNHVKEVAEVPEKQEASWYSLQPLRDYIEKRNGVLLVPRGI
jgi:hypothetical protein